MKLELPGFSACWPPLPFLPVHVGTEGGQHFVEWADLGSAPLRDPFFADSVWRALHRPLAQTLRYRLTIDDFVAHEAGEESLAPDGFIFHMSRCGSTLVAQILAAVPQHVVISEAAPLDAIVQISHVNTGLMGDRPAALLRAMVAALGRRRAGDQRHYFIKLDSWHTLALPLFRRVFPAVPWVFLYRDPVEVLVSHVRQPGAQMISDIVPPGLYGIDEDGARPGADYYSRVLYRICAAAIDHADSSDALLVNYRDLPGALFSRILPHFGVACTRTDRDLMNDAARHDAKAPNFEFAADSEAKQREATAFLRARADKHLGDLYPRLDALSGYFAC